MSISTRPLWTCPKCGHQFKLSDPDEIDERLEALICEAFRVGRREYLQARR